MVPWPAPISRSAPSRGVGDRLRCLHVPRHHRRRPRRVQHATLGNDHLQRLQAAVVQRDVVVHHEPEHVQHRRHAHRRRRVEIAVELIGRAGEIEDGLAGLPVDLDRHPNHRAGVHLVAEAAVGEHAEHAADRFLGVVLDVLHVRMHDVQPEMLDHPAQFLHTLLVRGDLGLEVGQVVAEVSCGVRRGREQLSRLFFHEAVAGNELEVVDQHSFLVDVPAVGWNGAGRDAADLGVMPARGHVERMSVSA